MAIRALSVVLLAVTMATPPKTSVVLYQPWSATGLRSGYTVEAKAHGACWTNSLTTDRADAYRCFIGDDIYDPCFAGPRHGVVACADDPFSKRVILVTLKKPLPNAINPTTQMLQPKGAPWGLRLANGDSCTFIAGAMEVVRGTRLNYGCKHSNPIFGFPDRTKPLWTGQTLGPNKSHWKSAAIVMAVF
jgi:hypothetical protein